ncbi:hypothetical protein PG993_010065 [Apiospora rasikravindrae]|uniref:Uncharacterized protein n=1 Tax=Apiospora rasikravindrae TaxID=990691 RepID=A0ABR1SL64_9PEZI
MSAPTSPSPAQGTSTQADESQLPSGQCRNKGSSMRMRWLYFEPRPSIRDVRVWTPVVLSYQGGRASCGQDPCGAAFTTALGDTLKRLGQLEGQFEKSKDEIAHESRGLYNQISRVWQTVDQLAKREAASNDSLAEHDGQLIKHSAEIQRIGGRLMETDDAAIELEERVDRLEASYDNDDDIRCRNSDGAVQGPRSTTPVEMEQSSVQPVPLGSSMSPDPLDHQHSGQPHEKTPASPWTVHVSLLPSSSQPFPFEKDTTAYKRCLSRGLHQMIAVPGTDSESFIKTVSKAFGDLLKGRTWVPLQARLCDAESLQGLPMLRPLDPSLIGEKYDVDFLRTHCAVCGPNGRLDSLYIAMASDSISWHFLRRQPCYLEGLEDSWAYDEYLDPDDRFEDGEERGRPSAGDILPTLPTLKRAASEMSRTPSFSSGSGVMEPEGSRPKVARTTCITVPVEIRRRVETV